MLSSASSLATAVNEYVLVPTTAGRPSSDPAGASTVSTVSPFDPRVSSAVPFHTM